MAFSPDDHPAVGYDEGIGGDGSGLRNGERDGLRDLLLGECIFGDRSLD